ncbi:MAG: SemiSWEET transporter [Flavobacteriaceae bacterium]|nr:SemiSWEET transporter [Flavobacteriaceae bacterium]
MIFNIEIVGLLAGVLTTSSFVPQVYKTWKEKSAENLSLSMFSLFFIGVIAWLYYGFYIDSLAMILANSVTAFLSAILIYFKIKYK